MQIRAERPEDHDSVASVQRLAFGESHRPDVVALVEDLRRSLRTELGLSLVAADDTGDVVGHVLFTRSLLDATRRLVDVQVLSPLAVRPDCQRQGIGSALVRRGLEILDRSGVPIVFLEGAPEYYAQFGFKPGRDYSFCRPSPRIPEAAFQARLLSGYEPWMAGRLVYRQVFWDHDAVGLRDAAHGGSAH